MHRSLDDNSADCIVHFVSLLRATQRPSLAQGKRSPADAEHCKVTISVVPWVNDYILRPCLCFWANLPAFTLLLLNIRGCGNRRLADFNFCCIILRITCFRFLATDQLLRLGRMNHFIRLLGFQAV